jgi:peroxin-6
VPYKRANEVVFFVITSVEYDVRHNDTPMDYMCAEKDFKELGCWVDSTITRVVQVGVKHAQVPDITTYLGIGEPWA